MSQRIRFWGTRGSIPTPGAETVRYGGNTPCVEVRPASGALVILDAGTGIRGLGSSLIERAGGAPIEGDIFLSHAHWDHIQGIPFFAPIFQPGNRFTIWCAPELEEATTRVIREQMSPSRGVFPVSFEDLSATVHFRTIGHPGYRGNGFQVRALPVRHPGGALGYRIETGNDGRGALVYISDNELAVDAPYDSSPEWRAELVRFIQGARVLVHDTMYTDVEYPSHVGWGHSRLKDVVELALDAGVQELLLFHYNPERSDRDVDRCVATALGYVAGRGTTLRVRGAAEGMEIELEA